MTIKNFLTRERDFHRASGEHRQFARDDFMRERVGLAAKAAANRCRDDADAARGQLQSFRQRAMNVMRRLRRTPQRQMSVGRKRRERGMIFEREMRVALIKIILFKNIIRFRKPRVQIAKFQRHHFVNVVMVGMFARMNRVARFVERFVHRHNRRQRFVLDVNELQRAFGGFNIQRRHRRHRVADKTHLVHAQRLFVLTARQNPVLDWHIASGNHRDDAGQFLRVQRVNALDARVRHRAA